MGNRRKVVYVTEGKIGGPEKRRERPTADRGQALWAGTGAAAASGTDYRKGDNQ